LEETMAEPMPDSAETQRLLELVRMGAPRALDQLFARHRPFLSQLVELRMDARLRQRVDPSDVVQEAQLEATRRLEAYLQAPRLPFRLWLRELTQDRLLMLRRFHVGTARRAVGREVALPDRSSLLLAQQLVSRGAAPGQRLDQEQLARRVRQAVGQLPDTDREVLLMRTFEGLSFEEVSLALGIDVAAVRKRHGRALLRLGKILAAGGLGGSDL
jgi:RNA polymerase sigma-70 factor (ECF subfamily)